jgi:hypothetical protein
MIQLFAKCPLHLHQVAPLMAVTRKVEEDMAVAEEAEEEEAEVEEGGVVENPSRVQADGSLTTTGKQCRSTKKRRYEPNEVIMQKGK